MKTRYIGYLIAVLIITSLGCATSPKKIDLSTIPMPPREVEVKRTPGSIWPGERSQNRLFADLKARDIGDIVTVLIVEKTEAKKEAVTSTSKSTEEDASITEFFGIPLNFGMRNLLHQGSPFKPSVKGGRTSKVEASGSTERKGEITATIAARVTHVLPNGNLFIEGRKETKVNNEKQYIVLSGIIRPEDISYNNTIRSDMIADLRLELSGVGVLSERQRPGWFTKLLDIIWPF